MNLALVSTGSIWMMFANEEDAMCKKVIVPKHGVDILFILYIPCAKYQDEYPTR